jgi:alcohol dehydrogenase (cytochrome c)
MRAPVCVFALLAAAASAQDLGLTPEQILHPAPDSWPTYHGDYSGRHFSPLDQINRLNVKSLSLQWVMRPGTTMQGAIVAGDGPEPAPGANTAGASGLNVKATPLVVNGMIYLSTQDNAWAIDARTGKEVWHYFWKTRGGNRLGNRGAGMYGNWIFFETPDDYVISLDAATGKERWHKQIADVRAEYYSTPAPVVIRNHVLIGTGGDYLDVPAWLESRDPETGEIQWKWNATPRPGQPGAETWPDQFSMEHGGGSPWQPPTYDPELNLIYVTTGNPQPVMIGDSRKGDNLWTSSIVALNPDTGKMAWYFQSSPHDPHDWDATQVPVLFDATIGGQPRKLLAHACRNGIFFVLDRVTGKNILSKPFIETANWSLGFAPNGQPIPNPAKEASVGGSLVSPHNGGASNWPPPTYDPETGLFYVNTVEGYSLHYRVVAEGDKVGAYGGDAEHSLGGIGASLRAIDVKTGQQKWVHPYPTADGTGPRPESLGGLLSTAGHLLFGGGPSGHLIAYDPADGKILWHSGLAAPVSNTPITYMLDGAQCVLVAAGDSLYSFRIQR